MKKMLLMFLFVMFVTNIIHAGSFLGANSLVVVRVGDGTTILSSAAIPVNLCEYNFAGTLLQTIPLPTAVSGSNKKLLLGGTASSEGALALSQSGSYLVLAGYDIPDKTAAPSGTASATYNRVVATVDATGTVNTTTALTDAFTALAIRGAASTDGTKFWLSGSNQGVRYTTLGATTSTQLNSAAPTNLRAINIFNGQLYVSSATTSWQGVSSDGTGLPTVPTPAITILPGFPTAAGPSPYGFFMTPDGQTIYVADDRTPGTNTGGIQKWILSGGTWTLTYTLCTGVTTGFRGITACCFDGNNPVIYVTSTETSANKIYTVTDNGVSSPFTLLATAPANTVFRGIAFAPPGLCPVELSSFTSIVNGRNVNLNWETKTEKNSDKFVIEKQTIGGNWEAIGSVKAAVLSNSTKQYSFSDKNLNTGNYQYRLKMVDNDGSSTNSFVTEVSVSSPKNFELLQNYPNPFNPSTKISYNLPSDSRVTLDIYNVLGVRVGQLVNKDQSAGYYSVDFNSSSLSKSISSGVYLYKITTVDKVTGNSFSAIKKMMMLK